MKNLIDESTFVMSMHRLLLMLSSSGIGLVRLPEPHSIPHTDAVQGLAEAVEAFARTESMSEGGRNLLHNYLSDHLFEQSADGFGRIQIEKSTFARVASIDKDS